MVCVAPRHASPESLGYVDQLGVWLQAEHAAGRERALCCMGGGATPPRPKPCCPGIPLQLAAKRGFGTPAESAVCTPLCVSKKLKGNSEGAAARRRGLAKSVERGALS